MKIVAPIAPETLRALRAGDTVELSGVLYTARDAAHKRMTETLAAGGALPVDLRGQTVFYAGPTPTPPGKATGAIGPTTSVRMDPYTPAMLRYGVKALVGKGDRGAETRDALKENGAVYFVAVGGCAAYMASCVTRSEVVAYDDLGPESIKRLEVRDLPLTVAIDAQGRDFYDVGQRRYREGILPDEKC